MTQAYQDNVYAVEAMGPTVLTQGLFETLSTQKYALGHILRLNDGRVFCYAKNGSSALAAGVLCQSSAANGSTDYTNCAVAEDGTTGGRIGDTTLTVTLNGSTHGIAANALADGFVHIYSGTGAGHQYKVLSNTAAAAGGTTIITLRDPLRAALASATTVTLAPSIYAGVIIRPATGTGVPVGITPIAVGASEYFWIQVSGRCCALQDGAWSVNAPLVPSSSVAGALTAQAETTYAPEIGFACKAGADTKYGDLVLVLGT